MKLRPRRAPINLLKTRVPIESRTKKHPRLLIWTLRGNVRNSKLADGRASRCNSRRQLQLHSPSTSIAAPAASRKSARSSFSIARRAKLFVGNRFRLTLAAGSFVRCCVLPTPVRCWGIAGQTIAGVVSTSGAVLVVTGLGLALRRLFAWLRRRVKFKQTVGAVARTVPDSVGD
ncbi:MAG: hypothetical protein LC794_20665 [Acidobacteria bacterium]|nr:hypothetical protein [Acidobacteriota bacterium]